MRLELLVLLCALLASLLHSPLQAEVSTEPYAAYKLKDLSGDEQGFLANTSTDGFLVMGGLDLPRQQACYLLLELEFKQPMFRPGMFEIFWAVTPNAFSEAQKARVMLSHKDTNQANTFVVPLCKLYGFSGNLSAPHYQQNIVGLRLDYPMNRDIAIKISRFELLSNDALQELMQDTEWVVLEPFERLSGGAFRSFDVVIPKVFFGVEDGLKRLGQDWPFLVFWLLLILSAIGLLIRGLPRQS